METFLIDECKLTWNAPKSFAGRGPSNWLDARRRDPIPSPTDNKDRTVSQGMLW